MRTNQSPAYPMKSNLPRRVVMAWLVLLALAPPMVQAADIVSAGGTHSLAVTENGSVVWSWGSNQHGQLGDGSAIDRKVPVQVQIPDGVSAVSAGYTHSLALGMDGRVWIWGDEYGYLGGGSTTDRRTPVQIQGLSDVIAIAAGGVHSLALKNDGTVYAWGWNGNSQPGDGSEGQETPVQVQGLSDVSAVTAGGAHNLVVKADGTVWAWGWNDFGQLGNGSRIGSSTPMQVQGLSDVSAVSAGFAHSLALKTDGSVWVWGMQGDVACSDNCPVTEIPIQVPELTNVTAVAAGQGYSLALKGDGTLWAWGWNGYGQLGNGSYGDQGTPVQVQSLSGMIAISAGLGGHSLALDADKMAWIWGNNGFGQLGEGTVINRYAPVHPVGSDGVPLFLGLIVDIPATVAEDAGVLTGTIRYPAAPAADLLVNMTSSDPSVLTVPGAVILSAGRTSVNFELAVLDNTILNGTRTVNITAVASGCPTGFSEIAVHDNETGVLAVTIVPVTAKEGDGLLPGRGNIRVNMAVGRDTAVSLASSDTAKLQVPRSVTIPSGQVYASFDLMVIDNAVIDGTKTVIVTASVGGWTSGSAMMDVADNETKLLSVTLPAVAPEGRNVVFSGAGNVTIPGRWVTDLIVRLSSNDESEAIVPSTVTIPAGQTSALFDLTVADDGLADGMQAATITASAPDWLSGSATINVADRDGLYITPGIAGGGSVSMALKGDGTLLSWGCSASISGSCSPQITPERVINLPTVVAVAGGRGHALAVGGDGMLWVCGQNGSGQLGIGTTQAKVSPVQLPGLTGVMAVAAGWNHSLALGLNGTISAWGANGNGQVGDGSTDDKLEPVAVFDLTDVTAIAAGARHSLALKTDGSAWAWGANWNGQLGDGSLYSRTTPVQVNGLSGLTAIAAGGDHSLALKSDGTVWAWGANAYGQLGDGTHDDRMIPVRVKGLSGITGISAGASHNLALRSDGILWAWGSHRNGALGIGMQEDQTTPVMITGFSGVVGIAAVHNHSLALKSDGSLWAWGSNQDGQLGIGTIGSNQISPARVLGIGGTGFLSLETMNISFPLVVTEGDGFIQGTLHISESLATDLVVQLTSENPAALSVPATVTIPAGQTSVSFTVAIPDDSILTGPRSIAFKVSAPGHHAFTGTSQIMDNEPPGLTVGIPATATKGSSILYGQGIVQVLSAVGNDIMVGLSSSDPGAISVPAMVTIPAGGRAVPFDLTVIDNGMIDGPKTVTITASVPGWPSAGAPIELRDNKTIKIIVPAVTVARGSTLTGGGQVSIFAMPSMDLTIDLLSSDASKVTVPAKVLIPAGQRSAVFNLTIIDLTPENQPVTVTASAADWISGINMITVRETVHPSVTAGWRHSLALKNNANVWAWGENGSGNLGDGTTEPRNTAVWTSGLGDIIAIAGGSDHSLALKSDGMIWSWGKNGSGQLGDGMTTGRSIPAQISNVMDVSAISAGSAHSLARKSDGSVWAWGANGCGQLGNPTPTDRLIPQQIAGMTGCSAISAGSCHSLALQSDGTVRAWGANEAGQLGNGTLINSSVPVQVSSLTDVIAISGGGFHSLALKSDGTVWAWGANGAGQLGDGTMTGSSAPVQVLNLTGIFAIAAGYAHSLALKSDGMVWAWGSNGIGQLGDGTTLDRSIPAQVPTLTAVSEIAAGMNYGLAVKSDGTVWAWGDNGSGQLGDGTTLPRNSPVQVHGTDDTGYFHLAPAGGNPPYLSGNSAPADGAADVPLEIQSATLTWTGGDPDAGDTAAYDVYFGTSRESLAKVSNPSNDLSVVRNGLFGGITYYWRVVAHDLQGHDAIGPVWRFTPTGTLPDLSVGAVAWTPSENIVTGDLVAFTATIRNNGGSAAGGFYVNFLVDGRSIGTDFVNAPVSAGGTLDVKCSWRPTGIGGEPTVVVIVDTENVIPESDEGNNMTSNILPYIADTTPPQIIYTNPVQGAFINHTGTVSVGLSDPYDGILERGNIHDSIVMMNSAGEMIAGTVHETYFMNSVFVFTPSSVLVEDSYTVSVTVKDLAGNTSNYSFSFAIDATAPPVPMVNSLPASTSNIHPVISGTKEAYAAILMNGVKIVSNTAETVWQYEATLESGMNQLTFTARDRADNVSSSATVSILFDDRPPMAVATLTANGRGSGTVIALNWNGYDETVDGDIASYRIYAETENFSSATGLLAKATVPAGTVAYTLSGLNRNVTYYITAIAVDVGGNALHAVTPVACATLDVVPPNNVTDLHVLSFDTRLVFTWSPPTGSAGDLAGYRVYFNNETAGIDIPVTQGTYERAGLSASTAYSLRITSLDLSGNENSGAEVTGMTLLPNPANLTLQPKNGYVNLSWSGVQPAGLVKHYAVYVRENAFTDVTGMTPRLTISGTSAKVASLVNNRTYYFAVTTVNLYDGELRQASSKAGKPVPDVQGPQLSEVRAGGLMLENGLQLHRSSTITLSAADDSGVSRVEFFVDGVLMSPVYGGTYGFLWDIAPWADGSHLLRIDAYDSIGNRTTQEYALTVHLDLPNAPVISHPPGGLVTNATALNVTGTAESGSTVTVSINGAAAGSAKVDGEGRFSATVNLTVGENHIRAAASNRAGVGPESDEAFIVLDVSLPGSPQTLAARGEAGGQIYLSWKAASGTHIQGYNIFRSQVSFPSVEGMQPVNAAPVATASYMDLPAEDGTYFYRVIALNKAGVVSDPSAEASAVSDREAPRAVTILYMPRGAHDPQTSRMGPGRVDLVLTLSEALQTLPFLSITPDGGTPIPVEVTKAEGTNFNGSFVIESATPSGVAYAIFSGRDMVGNRGTQIGEGATIQIDTAPPTIRSLTIQPRSPVRNDDRNPVTIAVTAGFDERMKPGAAPEFFYWLSGPGRQETAVTLSRMAMPENGDEETWQGSFTLPDDAGQVVPETLSFAYRGRDDLDNTGSSFPVSNTFQVYQENLPPLDAPAGLIGAAQPAGKIKLTWTPLADAEGYALYRKAPGESDLKLLQRLGIISGYIDQPSTEGVYGYAIASIRRENGEEAVSGMGAAIEALSDSTAPEAPEDLNLHLLPQGVQAAWTASSSPELVTYRLYRSAFPIVSTQGMTPLKAGIRQTEAVDNAPSPTDHYYAVIAADTAGNESVPSNSDYFNFGLLPVSTLNIRQSETDPPVVGWTDSRGAGVLGWNIYIGPESQEIRMNQVLLASASYVDVGYSGDERRYTVRPVDNNHQEGLGRSLLLPRMKVAPKQGMVIRRGLMNCLEFVVENRSAMPMENARLKVGIEGREHISGVFRLEGNESRVVTVIVGGYADLSGSAALQTTVEVTPHEGERVEIVRASTLSVGTGMLVLQMNNESFIRGSAGGVSFTLQNTGAGEIEITTATAAATEEITAMLLDRDENVLSTANLRQLFGGNVITLGNGNTVARIPAGGTFVSEPVMLPVPANAPENLTLRLKIAKLYYHQGQPDQVVMDGLSASRSINLTDTPYYGEILTVIPEAAMAGGTVSITGRAVERTTGSPMAKVPLKLYLTLRGFERKFDVLTGDDGAFTHPYRPQTSECGVYEIRAVHPDITDRPIQARVTVQGVTVNPERIAVNIPKNYPREITLNVKAGERTALENLRLTYEAQDQPTGQFPPGIHVTPGTSLAAMKENETATLNFTLWADNAASGAEMVVVKLVSGENNGQTWGIVRVDCRFSSSQPVLNFTPNHVETGVSLGKSALETVVLENTGLTELQNVNIVLLDGNNAPVPSWVYLTSGATNLGNIAIGDRREVVISFSPRADTAEGYYAFKLRVSSGNYPVTDINIYTAVTQSGSGGALFKVSDIYTGTIRDDIPVQGLSGATVTVQNERVLSVIRTRTTDVLGEASFMDLPAGWYRYRVTAANHQGRTGRFTVKPGVTAGTGVFLDYDLVTVAWDVTETTIRDRYDITLHATYETDVPAPVVVAEPASIKMPDMRPGDVYAGEFTLTNYGLIRADHLRIELPKDDEFFQFELLNALPSSIGPKERVTVTYRMMSLKSLAQGGNGSDGGGGASGCGFCIPIYYDYVCANGQWTGGSVIYCVTRSCTSSGGGGETIIPPGGGSSVFLNPQALPGAPCSPALVWREWFLDKWKEIKETFKDIIHTVGCTVNTVTRQYNDQVKDLAVKVPGGVIAVQRWFYNDRWQWEHTRDNLVFNRDGIGIASINKGGAIYSAYSPGLDLFVHGTYRIIAQDGGWQWKDKRGNWRFFDAGGRLISTGNRRGTIEKLLYEAGENGRLIGVADRNDNQVIWYERNAADQISAVRDSNGRRVDYTYVNGNLTNIRDILRNNAVHEYDAAGRMVKLVDAAGRETLVGYDAAGNINTVLDSQGAGHFFAFDYDNFRKESYARITTSSGMVKEIWYDRNDETKRVDINGRTVKTIVKDGQDLIVTDEKGNITRMDYDENDNLIKVSYPDNTMISFAYDHRFNSIKKLTDARGFVSTFDYDDQGNLTKKMEAAGTEAARITILTYDSTGRLLLKSRVEGDGTAPAAETALTYDGNDNIVTLTDPEGNVARFLEFDGMGNLLSMRDPRGNEWGYAYDAAGRIQSVINPLNETTRFEYDGAGNRTAVIDAKLKRFSFEYDEHNNIVKATDPEGQYTITDYNTDGLPVRVKDREGKSASSAYDNEGRLQTFTDGAGNRITVQYDESGGTVASSDLPVRIIYPTYVRTFQYDGRQRVTGEADILGSGNSLSRSYAYDSAGNLISLTDDENRTKTFVYDPLNRPVRIIDAVNGVTEQSYDNRGNLISLRDPKGNLTRYEYDRNDRLRKVIRPLLQETVYEYDQAGNRIVVIDAKGQRIIYEYDAANRLKKEKYYESGASLPSRMISYAHDSLGRFTSYDDGTTSANYTYDDNSRKLTETLHYGPFSLQYGYSYDANGLKRGMTFPNNLSYTYSYDGNNRLTAIALPSQGQITVSAYTWNSPARVILPGGSTTDYTYDPLMRLKTLTGKDPAQSQILLRNYEYSPVGNVISKATEHGGYSYAYDELSRLIRAENANKTSETYSYDPVGNRQASAVGANWTYNANNELLGYNGAEYQYDASGNTIRKIKNGIPTNYIYDPLDRLIRVEDGSGGVQASYGYDPFGRRLWKQVDGTRTYYLYSDEGLIGEYDQDGNEIKAYGYAPDSAWGANPLFQKTGGAYYFYQNDATGTPQKITDVSGHVVWEARYDTFGKATIITSEIVNHLRFAGHYHDQETELHYNGHRYYDPSIGRYISADPLGQGLNHYTYAFNNPNRFIDPEGLCAIGAGYGEKAAQWFADRHSETGDWYYYVGGLIVSLWTPETWLDTLLTVATAGSLSKAMLVKDSVISGEVRSGVDIVQRAMSKAELDYLQKHGTLRYGKAGTELDPHFVSDAVNADLTRARLRLALPRTPEVRVTLEVEKGVFGSPTIVKPLDLGNGRILPGGGSERTATGVVRARILKVGEFGRP